MIMFKDLKKGQEIKSNQLHPTILCSGKATAAAGLGLSRSDFSDDGADLQDLKESLELLKTNELVEIVIDQSKQLEKKTGGN